MKIWYDMDGTIANLYGVENWLPKLRAYDPSPYQDARPLVNLSLLARYLNKLQMCGHEIGIISWLSKDPDPVYGTMVTMAKYVWLAQHMPSVKWNFIHIVPYGTDKKTICGDGILFDDEVANRAAWGDGAYDPCEMFSVLSELIKAD